MSKLFFTFLILLGINTHAFAIDLLENGVITESALAGGDVSQTFDYVNPKNSTFSFDANFSIGNSGTEVRLTLLNNERRSLHLGVSYSAINVYDSLYNLITTLDLPSDMILNAFYTVSVTYTPDNTGSMGGLMNITLSLDDTPVFTKELLTVVEYFNNLSITGESVAQSGGDGAMDAAYNISSYSLSVSKLPKNRSVVIIPF